MKIKNEYVLKHEFNGLFYKTFFGALVDHKVDVFHFIQSYYRQFMRDNINESTFPIFEL